MSRAFVESRMFLFMKQNRPYGKRGAGDPPSRRDGQAWYLSQLLWQESPMVTSPPRGHFRVGFGFCVP